MSQACRGIPIAQHARIIFVLLETPLSEAIHAQALRLGAQIVSVTPNIADSLPQLLARLRNNASDNIFFVDSQLRLPPQWMEGLLRHAQHTPENTLVSTLGNFNWPSHTHLPTTFTPETPPEIASKHLGVASANLPHCAVSTDSFSPTCMYVPQALIAMATDLWIRAPALQENVPAKIAHAHRVASDVLAYHPASHPPPLQESPFFQAIARKIHINLEANPASAESCQGLRIGFILPISHIGGGANVIINEAAALSAMGAQVSLINFEANRGTIEFFYPDHPCHMQYIHKASDLADIAPAFDILVATAWITAEWMNRYLKDPAPRRAYYIQDFEPYFHEPHSDLHQRARNTYLQSPQTIFVTKTRWNAETLGRECGCQAHVLGPSYMQRHFYPSPIPNKSPCLTITAMIRPSSPRRGPDLTMRVLRTIAKRHAPHIAIALFGCSDQELHDKRYALDFNYRNHGEIDSRQVGNLLRASHIFVDYSTYQAMGLTTLEAMACGVAVIAPRSGGSSDFVQHGHNGLIIDTTDELSCIDALDTLVRDVQVRQAIARHAVFDALQYSAERCAHKFLEALCKNTDQLNNNGF